MSRFISGLANCHLPGLYSLVLSERESPQIGMRRVFYAGPDCKMDLWDGADFRLKPHNHRQSVRLKLIKGEAQNVSLVIGFGSMRLWCYRFRSALIEGSFTLERMYYENAHLSSCPITKDGLYLHWSEIHTVTALPGAAWVVEELDLAPKDTARCWSVSDHLEMSSDGLYCPMESGEIAEVEEMIYGKAGVALFR